MKRKAAILVCLMLLGASSSQSQCDWSKKIAFAIQRRYQTNKHACKALAAPPDEFNQAHALLENEMLSQLQFVTDARLNVWLEQHSQRILSQLNSGSIQTVRIAALPVPNAFATGQNVTFHAGLINWYLAPQRVLSELGYSREQIGEFMGQYGSLNPGENGLIGVLAHETSHNTLGHPDIRPLVLACEDFINAGIREVHDYEQVTSTGHQVHVSVPFSVRQVSWRTKPCLGHSDSRKWSRKPMSWVHGSRTGTPTIHWQCQSHFSGSLCSPVQPMLAVFRKCYAQAILNF